MMIKYDAIEKIKETLNQGKEFKGFKIVKWERDELLKYPLEHVYKEILPIRHTIDALLAELIEKITEEIKQNLPKYVRLEKFQMSDNDKNTYVIKVNVSLLDEIAMDILKDIVRNQSNFSVEYILDTIETEN